MNNIIGTTADSLATKLPIMLSFVILHKTSADELLIARPCLFMYPMLLYSASKRVDPQLPLFDKMPSCVNN